MEDCPGLYLVVSLVCEEQEVFEGVQAAYRILR